MTKIVPYASFPYADHALRELGVDDPNSKAEPTEECVSLLIEAAQFIRGMVAEMDLLEEIRGFITFSEEEKKEDAEEESKTEELQKLQQEAAEKVLTLDGEDMIEKFACKVLKEFLPCELLAQH